MQATDRVENLEYKGKKKEKSPEVFSNTDYTWTCKLSGNNLLAHVDATSKLSANVSG